jgi:hypothetical protein
MTWEGQIFMSTRTINGVVLALIQGVVTAPKNLDIS